VSLFETNQETCNQDGICAAVCPAGIIRFRKGEYPTPVADAEEVCIQCGHCVAVCPTGSFSHRDVSMEQCTPVQEDFQLTDRQCEHFLRSRRSIRVYKNKAVSREDLARLIEMARYAPSGHNSQCAEWLVLDNADELRGLSATVAEWMRWMIDNMQEVASSMHMGRTLKRWENGEDVFLRGAPALIVAHAREDNRMAPSSCTIALTYLELAATSMGLGCCWAGYFNAAATMFSPTKEALSLPLGHQSYGAMMVGYPKFKYHRLPSRKPPHITWRP
jgi:nitroreductase/NAD-dependent dihydropyrimidine dehydrogenase PreA subunit